MIPISTGTSDHYDGKYFEWQQRIGEFGGRANAFKFQDSIRSTDVVVDFGCGGGFLLKHLNCDRRIGIEPNVSAHATIRSNQVEVYATPREAVAALGEESADIIISNNALEHTLNPLEELKSLYPLLKRGGTILLAVPCDAPAYEWEANDINFHLYSWSPMNIGNLATEAGFKVISAYSRPHKWPPRYEKMQRLLGWRAFNLLCRIYGRVERSWVQVYVKAVRP